jgi:hypothetical protein
MLLAVVGSSSISSTRIAVSPVPGLKERKSLLRALKPSLTIWEMPGKG